MKFEVKIARIEGFVSTLNLFVDSGLRLQTPLLTWMSVDERVLVVQQFKQAVQCLKDAGFEVTGIEVLDSLISS